MASDIVIREQHKLDFPASCHTPTTPSPNPLERYTPYTHYIAVVQYFPTQALVSLSFTISGFFSHSVKTL